MNNSLRPTTFVIVRHGQTDWNVQNLLHGGGSQTSLNETGKKQAKELANVLKDIRFGEVISSDLERSIETVKGIALEHNLTVKTSTALREKHYGKYEGRHRTEAKEELKSLFAKWEKMSDVEKMNFRIYTNGETDGEAVTRFIRYLRELAIAYPGKTILIASHGGIMRYFLIKLGWATYSEMDTHAVNNTSYIKVESDGVDFFVKETYNIEKAKTRG